MQRYFGIVLVLAGIGTAATLLGGAHLATKTVVEQHHVTFQDVLEDDSDDDRPKGPGNPLAWYKNNFAAPESVKTPVFVCFAPGTPADVVEYVSQIETQGLDEPGPRYQLSTRWSGAQGTPRALTWSLAPDGINIPGGIGEAAAPNNLFVTLDTDFAALGGRAYWINRVQQCFDRWSQVTGLTYTRVTSGGNDWDDGAVWGSAGSPGARGDIRIGMHFIDGVNNTLAYNQFPSNGGDMVLDSSEGWQAGSSGSNQHRFFRNTIMHEHGHGIGLFHVCPAPPAFGGGSGTKLMEPFLNTAFDGPQHDDIRAGQRHYGDRYESNDTAGTATPIGAVDVGTPIHFGDISLPLTGTAPANSANLSIDANGKVDYWKFTVPGSRTASVTITPRGQSYASYAQDGACSNVTVNTNSLAIANLNVQIIDTNGVTVLGSSAVAASGSAETLSGVALPAAGDYYVRVDEGDSPSQSQLYFIDLSVTAPCEAPAINGISAANTACGVNYTSPAPSASGTAPLTWSLGGSPPAGMTINPGSGVISWPTPNMTGSPYTINVGVSNACGSDSTSFQLTVDPNPPAITPISDTGAVCSTLFTLTPSTTGGAAPLTWSLGGTPPVGMTIDVNTGTISWPNPVIAGTPYTIVVQADSAAGCGGTSDSFDITVVQADLNGDGAISTLDIPYLVDQLVGLTPPILCAADLNNDGFVNGDDLQLFVDLLL